MLPEKKLAGEVWALLAEKLTVQVASLDTDLLETGVLDSLAVVRLLVQIEERFGLTVEMENLEIEDLRSIRSITRLISRRNAAGAAV
jgi:acyl carrier protein